MSSHDARIAFEAAQHGLGDWMTAATDFAATPDGYLELLEALSIAELLADTSQQDRIHAALLRGEFRAVQADPSRSGASVAKAARISDLQSVADDFGVALEQVRRDHAISQILSALSTSEVAPSLTFYGGTALSRTLLPKLRLSEDIDLIASADRIETARAIEAAIGPHLARTHGEVNWEPPLSATRGAESAVLRLPSRVTIRIQLMSAIDVARWPTEFSSLVQRYPDAPPARLTTFTPAAFAAAKTVAWADRRAARDLYDLWALALLGAIDDAAADAFRRFGPGGRPNEWMFTQAPSEDHWTTALAHQGRVRVGPQDALRVVKQHWTALLND